MFLQYQKIKQLEKSLKNLENLVLGYTKIKYESVRMGDYLSDQARKKTEELILKGALETGAKITERDLADRLGMSRAPVREAIRELISVGLLEQISARQVIVRSLHLDEVKEIFSIREMLEARAASLAAEKISDEQLLTLSRLHSDMKDTASRSEFAAYFDLNMKFHRLIHEIAQSPRLATLIDQVMRESLLFRSRGLVDQANLRSSVEEHEQMLKAMKHRDHELTALLMRRHIQGGFDRLQLI